MRLNSIKLAGFKSFVDPTHITFQSNLTAVVGPNGCGKSNVVDAVRWVIGESSAKYLRAESMADVIFNGSDQRKPVNQASIELIFDNTDGRITGEYAKYNEISIRRELSRDGQSQYFLNGARCRRRDITDIFLGTGLGPRSYSIIEQGMISKIIEAKPAELSEHVKEVAGITKYEQRREETKNRIDHTKENLDRLTDLREELRKQGSHLQRQANAAERYKVLKDEQRLLKAQLQAIHWRELDLQIKELDTIIKTQEVQLEAKIAEHRSIDKDIEIYRDKQTELSDIFNEVQSRYYSLGSEIAQLEQRIQHAKERRRQLESDIAQANHNYEELQQQCDDDQSQFEDIQSDIVQVEISVENAVREDNASQEKLQNAEQEVQAWQERWEEFNESAADTMKQIDVEQTKIQHLEQKVGSLRQRLLRVEEERREHHFEVLETELSLISQQQSDCKSNLEATQQEISTVNEAIAQQRQSNVHFTQTLSEAQHQLQQLQARQTSLLSLQEVALGKNDEVVKSWLKQFNLDSKPRLAEGIRVEKGWELAVETVLSQYLDGVCVDDLRSSVEALENLENANVTLISRYLKSAEKKTQLTSLANKVKSQLPVDTLLSSIYVTESLEDAFNIVDSLEAHESVITRDGIWIGSQWVRIAKLTDEKRGVLQREQELEDLSAQIAEQESWVEEQQDILFKAQQRLSDLENQRDHLQRQVQIQSEQYRDVHAKYVTKETQLTQLRHREGVLSKEADEIKIQIDDAEKQLQETQNVWQEAVQRCEKDVAQRTYLMEKRDECRSGLEKTKREANFTRQKKDEFQVRLESLRSQTHFLQQSIHRAEKQLSTLKERKEQLSRMLEENVQPLPEYNQKLSELLEKRAEVENSLSAARKTLEEAEHALRQYEKKRAQVEEETQLLRTHLEQQKMMWQGLKVKQHTHKEQIEENEYVLDELLQSLLQEASISSWEDQITRVDARIQRLGPINLAAIDEYKQLSERLEYLDKQHNDLVNALETLENAIRKIDRETRARFKETFEQLNNTFKNYFPKIFGGGEASLELTSDDMLETGVLVKAQPPGKRNSSIHLLSGGEKALTAIALVFSLFQLNPAPFCMLDEVDAPLDDMNVGRFCNLVREMSETIQFIFISHNKISIEMGRQLMGVTMNEPGVSRLVSVDIDEAVAMATA